MALRPPDDITPNPNDPASVPPSTVGPDQLVTPGDPHGVTVEGADVFAGPPPRIMASAWSGWPSDWWPPAWQQSLTPQLTDTAWMCLDRNSSVLSTMPPYLVGAADYLGADWMNNPDPDVYNSFEEFSKELFWAFQLGEAFVITTARYATGWPARFHVVPPGLVSAELSPDGGRRYRIGDMPVSAGVSPTGPGGDLLHIRYSSSVADARGHGPLEAGGYRMVAAQVLTRYGTQLAAGGGIPAGILTVPGNRDPVQAATLQADWVDARASTVGKPAVLSGGVTWEAVQVDPVQMALVELLQFNEARIAELLGVPGPLVGLPAGPDSMTYKTMEGMYDYHWRTGLRPKARAVMSALSGWLLPRGTRVELNSDSYVQPEPLIRAQTAQILNSIVDPVTGQPALTVQEIRDAERLDNSVPTDVSAGVLK
jgi:HK97 family phage portal protein